MSYIDPTGETGFFGGGYGAIAGSQSVSRAPAMSLGSITEGVSLTEAVTVAATSAAPLSALKRPCGRTGLMSPSSAPGRRRQN
eukprot:gene2093-2725_t